MIAFSRSKLRDRRLMAKLTQKQLAKLVGVNPNLISMYETGYKEPVDLRVVNRMAEALGCQFNDLVHGKVTIDASMTLDEERLLNEFRSLTTGEQKFILKTIGGLHQ